MLSHKMLRTIRAMNTSELDSFVKTLSERILTKLDLGDITNNGKVIFSKGKAWLSANQDIEYRKALFEKLKQELGEKK